MNLKTLATGIVATVIMIVLASAVLLPVVSDATTTTKTFINEGEYQMTSDDTDYYFTYDPANSRLVINGETILFSDLGQENWTLISTDDRFIRLSNWAAQNYTLRLLRSDGQTIVASYTEYRFSEGICYYNHGGAWEEVYRYSPESFRGIVKSGGDYVTTSPEGAKILLDDSIIAQNGTTTVTSWWNSFQLYGTIGDMEVTSLTPSITVSDVEVHYSKLDGYNAYNFESVTFVADDGEHTVGATYNRVIVPIEVVAEKDSHPNDSQIAILNLIPILVFAGLVVGVIGMFVARRD